MVINIYFNICNVTVLTPHFVQSDSVGMYISILFPFIPPPVSSAVKTLSNSFIYTLVPYGITLGSTAIVPYLGLVPVAVIPPPVYA